MKNETDALKEEILELEEKRAKELRLLKGQFHTTLDSFKPINIIKSTFKEVSSSPELKSDFLSNAIGLGTGVLSKKVLLGSSHNPYKKFFGTLIQFAISNSVSKHVGGIKSTIENVLNYYFKQSKESKKEPKKEFQDNGNNGEFQESDNINKVFQN